MTGNGLQEWATNPREQITNKKEWFSKLTERISIYGYKCTNVTHRNANDIIKFCTRFQETIKTCKFNTPSSVKISFSLILFYCIKKAKGLDNKLFQLNDCPLLRNTITYI